MNDHQTDHSEFGPLAAVVPSIPRGSTRSGTMHTANTYSFMRAYWVGAPSRAGAKTPGAVSPTFCCFSLHAQPILLASQTHLTQMPTLLGRCPRLESVSLVFLPSQRWLTALSLVLCVPFLYQVVKGTEAPW